MLFFKTVPALIFMVVLNISCNSKEPEQTRTFWVNSLKVECNTGTGKTHCLQVYEGDSLNNAQWTFLYAPIEGFNFQPGYLQKIKIKEHILDPDKVPADGTSKTYLLVEVLEKQADPKTALNDIWALTHINSNGFETPNTPRLEINLTKMQAFGTDGCNNFSGSITKLDQSTLTFGPLASTRKMCTDMNVADQFNQALMKTQTYKHEQLTLYLYDKTGIELLRFKKVD